MDPRQLADETYEVIAAEVGPAEASRIMYLASRMLERQAQSDKVNDQTTLPFLHET